MKTQELWVRRDDLRVSKVVADEQQNLDTDLGDGEVLLQIDKFALTANNVSYAISGDMIGYWKFFPAGGAETATEWGIIPVWGFGDVVASKCAEVPVGERLWGYFPMASHLTIQPGKVRRSSLIDAAPHRAELPPVYNQYSRSATDSPELQTLEDERCLFFPLFVTSYMLFDYLIDNKFFAAEQVVIGSASSKTGFGLAHLLHHDQDVKTKVIGLTSPHNVAFVQSLQICDRIVPYGQIADLDPTVPTTFVDMAGSMDITSQLHHHFKGNLKESCSVGATHWEAKRGQVELPGAKPAFFFAPSQIQKRDQEWGAGTVMRKAYEASARIAADAGQHLTISHRRGADAVQASLLAMLDNDIPPSQGLMLSMNLEELA